MREYPKLGNYPRDTSRGELVEYVEKLVDWCVEAEMILKKHKEIE